MLLRLALIALILCLPIAARPDEASGVVQSVDKGDTFNVDGFGKVHLADVSCPDTTVYPGVQAKEFALENLVGVRVFLDIDNGTGRDPEGITNCMVYLCSPEGTPDLNRNFNVMMVESGHGTVSRDPRSEFNLSAMLAQG